MFVIPLDWAQVASPLQKASGDKEKVARTLETRTSP